MTCARLALKAVQRRRRPRRVHPADEPDDLNAAAPLMALDAANAGDLSALLDRLRDPTVTISIGERHWLADRIAPGNRHRPARAQEPLLYWWLCNAEGMGHLDAIQRIAATLHNKPSANNLQAVEKAIRRAARAGYDPGDGWRQRAQWWRDGSRWPDILPPALRPRDVMKFSDFLTRGRN